MFSSAPGPPLAPATSVLCSRKRIPVIPLDRQSLIIPPSLPDTTQMLPPHRSGRARTPVPILHWPREAQPHPLAGSPIARGHLHNAVSQPMGAAAESPAPPRGGCAPLGAASTTLHMQQVSIPGCTCFKCVMVLLSGKNLPQLILMYEHQFKILSITPANAN